MKNENTWKMNCPGELVQSRVLVLSKSFVFVFVFKIIPTNVNKRFHFCLRFEAEISGTSNSSSISNNNVFVPPQLRPIIGSNTYNQVQQKLQQQPKTIAAPPMLNHVPPPPTAPSFIPSFMAHNSDIMPEKSYCSEPTPVVLSSAPKLYTNRLSINPNTIQVPQVRPFKY